MLKAYKDGKTSVIIGSNDNLYDWTYVDNIVHAHILAAEKLEQATKPQSFAVRFEGINSTLQARTPPSSVRRPDGRWLPFETPVTDGKPDPPLPAVRNRLDQFHGMSDPEADIDAAEYAVAGQAFTISNGEPLYFWDFVRAVYREYAGFDNAAKAWSLPAGIAIVAGTLSEWVAWARGTETNFTKNRMIFLRAKRYHNIDRARLLLGYEPIVGMGEGIRRSVQWYKENEAK